MTVTRMQAGHIQALAALERDCFSAPWSAKALEEELQNPAALFLVAEEAGGVQGYVGCHVVLDEGYITNVAVSPACRRQGVGRRLVEALMRQARARALRFVTLEARASNDPARALYAGLGFKTVGVRRAYYTRPTEDGILMTYFLQEEPV